MLIFFTATLNAQVVNNIYSSYAIPKELLTDANAVVRKFDVVCDIKDMTTTIEKEHKIVTILNERGKRHAEPYFGYGKFSSIEDIEANFYDAAGKLVRKLKKKDIKDVKPYQEYVEDSRYKLIEFPHLPYPYTVEYIVETHSNQTMFYPQWMPQTDNRDAIENATLTIKMPAGIPLRYKEMNLSNKVEKTGNTYRWYLEKVKAFEVEPFTPAITRYLPRVVLAPRDFEIGGYKGKMDSWEALGLFQNQLNKDRQTLPPAVKEKILKMVADCKDDTCKIEKLYDYLQNTTRYFSIQLGIGGWQPISATDVEKAKYGDCKGLSNYMIAMLEVVGIKAHHVLLNRGSESTNKEMMQTDFPGVYFNHMMACVPMKNDTMWLECTNQTTAAGFLESSDDDRDVLVITPEGGKVAHTTRYDEKMNVERRDVKITLNTEGGAMVTSKTQYNGLAQDFHIQLEQVNEDLKKKVMYERLKINNFEIKEMRFDKFKKPKPYIEENLTLDVKSLGSVSGKRLFLPFNLFTKRESVPSLDSTRLFEVQADDRGFTEDETINIVLPDGYSLESKTTPLSIESIFGRFELTMNFQEKILTINRKLIVNNKVQPKDSFPKLVDFFKAVSKADKTKLVLVKTI
jgi:Domain of Unknown Function with PDB structure (DUF3857)/Transglutaminase-like superfamily